MKMLESAKILQNDGMLDIEAMERYIVEKLGGTIGAEYAQAQVSITFTEGRVESETTVSTETIEPETTTFAESTTAPAEETTPEEITNEAEQGSGCVSTLDSGILVCIAMVSLAFIAKKKQY